MKDFVADVSEKRPAMVPEGSPSPTSHRQRQVTTTDGSPPPTG
ncbi:hypothetical protein [Haloprofundus salinisoli]|nr:hypothetical protein [Haloprofundus salinisoli]